MEIRQLTEHNEMKKKIKRKKDFPSDSFFFANARSQLNIINIMKKIEMNKYRI